MKKREPERCQAPARSCQHLKFSWKNRIFLLTENQRTLLRNQCLWLQLFLDFSQQLLNFAWIISVAPKNRQKFKCSRHLAGTWHLSGSLVLNPYDFNSIFIFRPGSMPWDHSAMVPLKQTVTPSLGCQWKIQQGCHWPTTLPPTFCGY